MKELYLVGTEKEENEYQIESHLETFWASSAFYVPNAGNGL